MRSIRTDFIKAERVVESCVTREQLRSAQVYAELTSRCYNIRNIDERAIVISLLRGRLSKSIDLTRRRIHGVRL